MLFERTQGSAPERKNDDSFDAEDYIEDFIDKNDDDKDNDKNDGTNIVNDENNDNNYDDNIYINENLLKSTNSNCGKIEKKSATRNIFTLSFSSSEDLLKCWNYFWIKLVCLM